MDSWLTDEVKYLLSQPCLTISSVIARRLNNRIKGSKQNIDERAFTEYLVDALDTSSLENVWGSVIGLLRDQNIYLNTKIRKSTKENKTGADIGLIIQRRIKQNNSRSEIQYSCLIQCKRVDVNGQIDDFYHTVGDEEKTQSSLMLDITPSSFYFIFTPSCLLDIDYSLIPTAFIDAGKECSSPIWDMGHFGCDEIWFPLLSDSQIDSISGVLVVPALAVEAQRKKSKDAKLKDILPNCMPLWYWFSEILVAGFAGDPRQDVINTAANSVKFSIEINIGNG
ncbi:hypothetical protein H6G74_04400 [Nostoc spongiaeforme FACHB-130]|uniref:Restriction endonuclease n=1 Tax=Nostoc spongiaeforme FACHB-130 TaxID=1357510 RepID=A0ABR8FRI7_9NOSO|nr:hypothetical protein [Nostoc spongiaeforme]MBD2593570.1 hypothetical protein [Nostoc spongiaeforme FACHB-130]